MSRIAWERWAPVSGIAYVVLVVVAFGVVSDIGDSDEEIVAHFGDGGTRAGELAGFFLMVVAALFFMLFASTLRARLRSVEAEPKSLSALAFGAGVASAVLLVAALCLFVAVTFTTEFSDEFQLDPNVARLLDGAGYMLWVGSTMVASVLVATTSVLSVRTAVLPKWLGWLGFVVTVALLPAIFFVPFFVLLAWVLLVSVVMIARPSSLQPKDAAITEAN